MCNLLTVFGEIVTAVNECYLYMIVLSVSYPSLNWVAVCVIIPVGCIWQYGNKNNQSYFVM